ncbi:bacterioferritin [Desertimonas flava]|jgi:bacterioferritin|uniref:bacterioferritin n=1 Tax=Desertimonas flava TaxID=2064846 RepID=UPI000E351507|nr:bacterioferritin [Desertimonas flava]
MKGHDDIIELLNEVLTGELTAINQYFLHAKMCDNWGYKRLAHTIRDESIDEMKHAEALVERVLYLEGVPNLQRLSPLKIGETVPEQLTNDLAVEMAALKRLNDGIALCVSRGDNGTRELLADILTDEEHHVDWLETQLESIAQIGLENYLSQQLHES